VCACVCVGRKKCIQEFNIKQDPDSFVDNFNTVWQLEPIGMGTDNTAEFPSFVLKAVKVNLLQKVYSFFIVFT